MVLASLASLTSAAWTAPVSFAKLPAYLAPPLQIPTCTAATAWETAARVGDVVTGAGGIRTVRQGSAENAICSGGLF